MKRVSILTAILILFGFTAAGAFDAIAQLGAGSLCQKGSAPAFVINVGVDIPIVTVKEKGFTLLGQITGLYSEFEVEGVEGVTEIQAIKIYEINRKSLYTSPNEEFILSLGLGGGYWNFNNTNGKNEEAGAVMLQICITWRFIDFLFEAENIFLTDEWDARVLTGNINIGI